MKNEKQPTLIKAGRGIKAKIWTNSGPQGTFASVQFVRVYKDQAGQFQDSDSFSRNDLLHVAWLAQKAFELTEPPATKEKKANEN